MKEIKQQRKTRFLNTMMENKLKIISFCLLLQMVKVKPIFRIKCQRLLLFIFLLSKNYMYM